jgi:hypothetical protein
MDWEGWRNVFFVILYSLLGSLLFTTVTSLLMQAGLILTCYNMTKFERPHSNKILFDRKNNKY